MGLCEIVFSIPHKVSNTRTLACIKVGFENIWLTPNLKTTHNHA
jgi:hypothetical protein